MATHHPSENVQEEIKSLQFRLTYIQKSIDELSQQHKSGQISDDAFSEPYNRFKHDKTELEKQIKLKMRKE